MSDAHPDTPGTPSQPATGGTDAAAEQPQPSGAEPQPSGTEPTTAARPAPGVTHAPGVTDVPAPPQAPVDPRPKPEFGEYAPEGWEWKPEGDAAPQSGAAATAQPGTGGGQRGGATSPTVPGVPHNLGTNIPRARKGSGQAGAGTPYRAPAAPQQPGATTQGQPQPGNPQRVAHQQPYQAPAPAGRGGAQKPANTADRVITILLLAVGAFGALYSALALMGLNNMFAVMENAPGVSELTPPGWVDLAGKIAGMALLVAYGLMLVFTIRRLRARKLAFWAPLALGVLAAIVVTVIIVSAMVGTPELMQIMRDPEASTQLLEYLQGFPTA